MIIDNAISVFVIAIMIIMLVVAIKAITAKSLLDSVLFYSVLGMGSAFMFAIMKAPDVALTEAAIGTGLVALVFITAIRRTNSEETADEQQ